MIVVKLGRRLDPARIDEIIDLGIRTKYAMINGVPPPPYIPGTGYGPRQRNAPEPRAEDDGSPQEREFESSDTEE